jgi:hypothetical protein
MKNWMIFLILCGSLFFTACEEKTEWDLKTGPSDLLVVEGLITNERTSHTVKLSRPSADLNGPFPAVSGALVVISDGGNSTQLFEYPSGSGVYHSDTLQAVIGKIYYLYIDYKGKTYTASAAMVPVEPLQPLVYNKTGSNNQYEIVYQDTNDASKIEYWITWSYLPGYQESPFEETTARLVYYTLKSFDVNHIFKPEKAQVTFPVGSIVFRRKYSMSNAQQAFVRTMLSETEWRGSIFDVEKGNVITNLSEGAVGFFAVSTVVSDTTIIQSLN